MGANYRSGFRSPRWHCCLHIRPQPPACRRRWPPEAKLVICLGVGGFQVGLLAPGGAAAGEDIGRPGIGGRVVALVSVHPGGIAVLLPRPDHHVSRRWPPSGQNIICPGVGGFQVGLLAPGGAAAGEDIGRPAADSRVVALVPVHPGGIAVFSIRPDHQRVAGDGHRLSQTRHPPRCWRLSGRPAGSRSPAAREDIGRAGIEGRVVALVSVHPGGIAVLLRRPDHQRVAGDGHRAAK